MLEEERIEIAALEHTLGAAKGQSSVLRQQLELEEAQDAAEEQAEEVAEELERLGAATEGRRMRQLQAKLVSAKSVAQFQSAQRECEQIATLLDRSNQQQAAAHVRELHRTVRQVSATFAVKEATQRHAAAHDKAADMAQQALQREAAEAQCAQQAAA